MNKFQKKILIWLFALSLACPVGFLLPEYFHSGDAWGEWNLKTIQKKTGLVPKGMAKDAEIWKAPVPDYKIEENTSLAKQSLFYILSAVSGIALTLLITFGLIKFIGRNGKTP